MAKALIKRSRRQSDSQYESQQRMSWIDEGGIDLRAARANLLEFVAGLYEDALKLMQPPEPEPAPTPSATRPARNASPAKKKPVVRIKKKPPPRQKKKRPPPRQKRKPTPPKQKKRKKALPRVKKGGKKRK